MSTASPQPAPAVRATDFWQRYPQAWLLFRVGVIVVAAWLVFSPAMRGDWLWDDEGEITQNPEVTGDGGLWKIWVEPANADYFPLKSTVQWAEWRLWREQVVGYHVVSLGLHLAGALLLWNLFRKLGIQFAWLGGLLFVIHPLVVESVAWMAELKNTLSLPLLLLAMCAYIDYEERRRPADYFLSLAFFLASLLCKTSGVMLPVVLLLYHAWKRGTITRRDLRSTAAFFAVALVLGLVTVWFQSERSMAGWVVPLGGGLSRIAVAGLAALFYLRAFVAPLGLMPVYPRWAINPPSLSQFLPWLLFGAVFFACWRRRLGWGRHALFGLGFFIVTVAPVLGFVRMSYMRYSWVADHFVYLPIIGLIGLTVAGAGAGFGHLTPALRRGAVAICAILLIGMAMLSRWHATAFASAESFWIRALERNPQAWIAHNNLGKVRLLAGREREAITHFEQALAGDPDLAEAHNNLGIALSRVGRVPEGIGHFEQALRIKPDFVEARVNWGNSLIQQGRPVEAIEQYRQAVRAKLGLADAWNNLGNALFQSGQAPEAIAAFRHAVNSRPDYAEAYDNLGNVFIRLGNNEEAIRTYNQALRIAPGNAVLHNHLGFALIRVGRPSEAMAQFEEALRINPDFADAHTNLGGVLFQAGRVSEAIGHYKAALRINPNLVEARRNLQLLQTPSGNPADESLRPPP